MPAKLDRCVKAVKKTAWCKNVKCNPYAVCQASLKKKSVNVSKHKRGRSVVQSYSRRRPFKMKGWKKFPAIKAKMQRGANVNLSWINENRHELLYLNEFLIGSAFPDSRKFTGKTEWVLQNSTGNINRNFKKRANALKYAIEYMEENPNGYKR